MACSSNEELLSDDDEELLSDDDELNDDIEALKKACRVNPGIGGDVSGESSDDDLELIRSFQQRFAISPGVVEELPSDFSDSEDSFAENLETLRAIQRRFAAYNDTDSLPNEDGGCKSKISFEKATDEAKLADKSYEFPQSAHVFFGAILKNRSCQIHLRRKMGEMETKLEHLDQLIKKVKQLKDFQLSCKRRSSGRALSLNMDARVQLISPPDQIRNSKIDENNVHAMYKGPQENPHVANCREALANYPADRSSVKWTKDDKENVFKGLKQQFQEMLYKQSIDNLSDEADGSTEGNDIDSIIRSIKDLDITSENIRLFLHKVDWEKLATMHVPRHSGGECQSRFLSCDDPSINCNQWTKIEEKKLLHIVEQKGPSNWIDISASLGTRRTPFDCLAHYQRSLNVDMQGKKWTKEEDNRLCAAVQTYGTSNWQAVASMVKKRTGAQCSDRWSRALHPARQKSGHWDSEEDKPLKVAVTILGTQWKKVANYVLGRTPRQCSERWLNNLDPCLNFEKWTDEEDSRLKVAFAKHGRCWSEVAKCIPPRTDNQCLRRWKVLFPHEALLVTRATNIKEVACRSNFVGRECDRPALGPNDFRWSDTGHKTISENGDSYRRNKIRPSSRRKKANNHSEEGSPTEICSEDVPISSIGREVENRHCRSHRKRSKNSYSKKNEAGLAGEINRSGVKLSFPDSMTLMDIKKKLMSVNGHNANKKLKVLGACSKRRHYCPELDGVSKKSSLMEDDNITLSSFLERQHLSNADGKKSEVLSRFSDVEVLVTYKRRKHNLEADS